MTPELVDLILNGGAVVALLWIINLFLSGAIRTRGAAADGKKASDELVAELRSDRDEWKAIAKSAISDVGELGEALAVRNRIDESVIKQAIRDRQVDQR